MTESNSIQEEFISTVSHEMRTPLTSIRGFSQTLLASWDKISDEDKKKFISIIEEQSNRLIRLVENILSVQKLKTDRIVRKQLNINSSIEKILTVIKQKYTNTNFILDINKNIPTILLDEDKFQQIMTNLLDNAAKYSEENSSVQIKTELLDNAILIKVIDMGIGIRVEDFPKVFQKFTRLENFLISKTQGNGLGLYITKQLVESMNGNITFESEYQKGSTFIVKFPILNQEEVLKCTQTS